MASSVLRTTPTTGLAPPSRISWAWVGVVPFFVFALMFLILPTSFLAIGAFQDAAGRLTLQNVLDLFQPTILASYAISLKVSGASAIGGALLGFFLAYAAIAGGLPQWVRPSWPTPPSPGDCPSGSGRPS
jgi:putative spermidine/putrescine transport system permease protein